MLIFAVISISFINGEETCGTLDRGRDKDGDEGDSSALVSLLASTSSVPDSTGLAGVSDSEGFLEVKVPVGGTEGLDSRKRLYSTGVYFSKLDSSLLGGGLLDLNVLG